MTATLRSRDMAQGVTRPVDHPRGVRRDLPDPRSFPLVDGFRFDVTCPHCGGTLEQQNQQPPLTNSRRMVIVACTERSCRKNYTLEVRLDPMPLFSKTMPQERGLKHSAPGRSVTREVSSRS